VFETRQAHLTVKKGIGTVVAGFKKKEHNFNKANIFN